MGERLKECQLIFILGHIFSLRLRFLVKDTHFALHVPATTTKAEEILFVKCFIVCSKQETETNKLTKLTSPVVF